MVGIRHPKCGIDRGLVRVGRRSGEIVDGESREYPILRRDLVVDAA